MATDFPSPLDKAKFDIPPPLPEWSQKKKAASKFEVPPPPASWQAPKAEAKVKERPSYLTGSIVKTVTGKGPTDLYDDVIKAVNGMVPEDVKRDRPADFSIRLGESLLRAGPEIAEFVSSPVGMALIGAHFVPYTAPFAIAADIGLGIYQGIQTVPAVSRAIKTGTPEDIAGAIKDAFYTWGFAKGMKKLAKPAPLPEAVKAKPEATIERLRSASPEEKPALLAELAKAPTAMKERLRYWAYRTPYVNTAASLVGVNKPPLLDAAAYLVNDRINQLNLEDFKAKRLAYEIKKELPSGERDVKVLGYVLQGSKSAADVGLSPKGQRMIEKIRAFNAQSDAMLREAYGDDIPLQDAQSYLSQIWDFGRDKDKARLATRRLMRDPFLQKKKISSYEEGINMGLKPLYNDVSDIIVARHNAAARAVQNQKYANVLRDMGALLSEQEHESFNRLAVETGQPLLHWPQAEAHALDRATYIGKGKRGETILMPRPVRVQPDVKMAVEAVFGQPFRSVGFGALEQMRSWSKQNAVMYSLFHHWALTEQGQAIAAAHGGPLERISGVAKSTFFANPDFWKGLKTGVWEVAGKPTPHDPPPMRLKPEFVQDAIASGLDLRTGETETSFVRTLRKLGDRSGPLGKVVSAPFRAMGNVNYIFNRSLWDYYMQGQMLHAYERIKSSELQRLGPEATSEKIAEVSRATAKHVNSAFGSENMERLLMSPKGRQAMNFALFAPVWTLSNLRVLSNGFENAASARLATRYAAGAAVTWFLTTQLANYALSGWYNTQDKNGKRGAHWSWDNAGPPMMVAGKPIGDLSDNALNISLGYNADGSQRFIKFGRGFREPAMWVLAPLQTLAGKLSLPIKVLMAEVTRHEPGSGYQVIGPPGSPGETAQRIAVGSELVTPFALQGVRQKVERALLPETFPEAPSPSPFGLMTSKGLSRTKAADSLEQIMNAGRADLVPELKKAAEANHIPWGDVVRIYKSRLSSRKRTAKGIKQRYSERGELVTR